MKHAAGLRLHVDAIDGLGLEPTDEEVAWGMPRTEREKLFADVTEHGWEYACERMNERLAVSPDDTWHHAVRVTKDRCVTISTVKKREV